MMEGELEESKFIDASLDVVEIDPLQGDRGVIRRLATKAPDVEDHVPIHLGAADFPWGGCLRNAQDISLPKAIDRIGLSVLAHLDDGGKTAQEQQVVAELSFQNVARY